MQSEFLLSLIDDSSHQPSLFELYFHDQLLSMFKPAVRHILHALFASHAQATTFLADYFEGFYLLIQSGVEAYFLSSSRPSLFIERIYLFERVVQQADGKYASIDSLQRIISFAYFVIVPRLLKMMQQLSEYADRWEQRSNEQPSVQATTWLSRLRKTIRGMAIYTLKLISKAVPYIQFTEGIVIGIYRLLYVLGRSSYHHPLFAFLNMKLVKSKIITQQNAVPGSAVPSPNNLHLRLMFGVIFAMRGIDWLVNTDHSSELLSTRIQKPLPPPPFPKAIKTGRGCIRSPADPTLCPICCTQRTNACVASSGFVFCYLCILEEVRNHGKCPVTNLPCTEKDLIRVYESATVITS